MKKILISGLFVMSLLVPAVSSAKVCFRCKSKKPTEFVCAQKDTFTARKNARKLGCDISSYSSSCKCGATVDYKITLNNTPWWFFPTR
ncbi:MAG: hypothetical protein JXR95_15845 [Deltaproteobacteria bacterium]|nr:hypothetical protein [Deltaproteobacteria bacterium]